MKLDKNESFSAPQTSKVHGRIPRDVRFDGIIHIKLTVSSGRCKICHTNTTKMCGKCNVRLHCDRGKTCFDDLHSQEKA